MKFLHAVDFNSILFLLHAPRSQRGFYILVFYLLNSVCDYSSGGVFYIGLKVQFGFIVDYQFEPKERVMLL